MSTGMRGEASEFKPARWLGCGGDPSSVAEACLHAGIRLDCTECPGGARRADRCTEGRKRSLCRLRAGAEPCSQPQLKFLDTGAGSAWAFLSRSEAQPPPHSSRGAHNERYFIVPTLKL